MRKVEHYATNYYENVKVIIIAPSMTLEQATVEYCISSGYVKVETKEQKILITHISNVVIEVD
ncbi:MAG: hypothetical protein HC875_10295 [Anaerolineales bacterium]|nr:hypothetical protein [Anaerolineales bacterium]